MLPSDSGIWPTELSLASTLELLSATGDPIATTDSMPAMPSSDYRLPNLELGPAPPASHHQYPLWVDPVLSHVSDDVSPAILPDLLAQPIWDAPVYRGLYGLDGKTSDPLDTDLDDTWVDSAASGGIPPDEPDDSWLFWDDEADQTHPSVLKYIFEPDEISDTTLAVESLGEAGKQEENRASDKHDDNVLPKLLPARRPFPNLSLPLATSRAPSEEERPRKKALTIILENGVASVKDYQVPAKRGVRRTKLSKEKSAAVASKRKTHEICIKCKVARTEVRQPFPSFR